MKRLLSTLTLLLTAYCLQAQITITLTDMPVAGDTLRYTNANPLTSPTVSADSGASMNWVYSLTGISQAIDTYKTGIEVNPLYATTIPPTAAGIKVADSIPGLSAIASGITISNIYNFYDHLSTPSAYITESFAASLVGFPISANYTTPDAIYFFPLTYLRTDSSDYQFHFSLLTAGSIKQMGYRKTRVDGWGTITTPYFTTPVSALRVRSELHEVDSVNFGGNDFGLPRVTVEYKWLANGEHYPALYVSSAVIGGLEVPTFVRYRDVYREELNTNAVPAVGNSRAILSAYPNPAVNGTTTLNLPAGWNNYYVEVFDASSRLLATYHNERTIDLGAYPAGQYIARVTCGQAIGFVQLVK